MHIKSLYYSPIFIVDVIYDVDESRQVTVLMSEFNPFNWFLQIAYTDYKNTTCCHGSAVDLFLW